jgi:ABC-type phosphonate transport system ATPase subunit
VGLQVAWAASLTDDPTEKLDSALDLAAWLTTVDIRDRRLLADRLAGMSLQEVAQRADLSLTTAFQRLRQLGVAHWLAEHIRVADVAMARFLTSAR